MNLNLKQQEVVELVQNGHNVIVNGYAGFGKTTLAMEIARTNPDKRVVLLTYNKLLQQDSEKRRQKLKISNLTCRTFHAFFGNLINDVKKEISDGIDKSWSFYYKNDKELALGLKHILPYLDRLSFSGDIIILDEFQDANELILFFLKQVIRLDTQVVVLGDEHQEIFRSINRSDFRFFKNFAAFFPEKNWKNVFCNETMRISHVGSNFVNYCLFYPKLKESTAEYILDSGNYGIKMVSQRMDDSDATVTFLAHVPTHDIFLGPNYDHETFERKQWENMAFKKSVTFIKKWIEKRIETDHFQFDDIVVLLPSRNRNRVIEELKFWLSSEKNWPLFYDDNQPHKASEQKGKILFSTIHRFKGCERQCVILYGFSNDHFGKNKHPARDVLGINNLMYVGITRAINHLLVIETLLPLEEEDLYRSRFNWLPDSEEMANDFKKLGINYVDFTEDLDPVLNLYPAERQKTILKVSAQTFQKIYMPSDVISGMERIIADGQITENMVPVRYHYDLLPNSVRTNMAFKVVNGHVTLNHESQKSLVENVEQINGIYFLNEFLATKTTDFYANLAAGLEDYFQELLLLDFPYKTQFFARLKCFWSELTLRLGNHTNVTTENKLRLAALQLWVSKLGRFHTFNEIQFDDFNWITNLGLVQNMVEKTDEILSSFGLSSVNSNFFIRKNISFDSAIKGPAFLEKCRSTFKLQKIDVVEIDCEFGLLNDDGLYYFVFGDGNISFEQKILTLFNLFMFNIFAEFLPPATKPPRFASILNASTGELIRFSYQKSVLLELFQRFIPIFLHGLDDDLNESDADFTARILASFSGENLKIWLNTYEDKTVS